MRKGQIRKVYRRWLQWDFPPSERRPLHRVLKLVSQGKYECLGLWWGREQVGYAFAVLDGTGGALLDYYAMAPGCRGKGFGSAFFPLLCARYPGGILLEVESPEQAPDKENEALRRRRLDFYRRLGMEPAGIRCLLYGVPYEILWWKGRWKKEELLGRLDGFYCRLMTPRMREENLRYGWPGEGGSGFTFGARESIIKEKTG